MQQLHEPEPSTGYKSAFSLIWGMMGVALLVGAILYSRYLLNYGGGDEPAIATVGAYGYFAQDAAVTVTASTDGARTKWDVLFPVGSYVLTVPRNSTCNWVNEVSLPPPHVEQGAFTNAGFGIVLIDASMRTREGDLVCSAPVSPATISYAGRAIEVEEPEITTHDMGLSTYSKAPAAPVYFRPNFDNEESLEFFGGSSNSGKATVDTNENVELVYTDAKADGERNVGLVIIGAVIALGAAMILESLRPVVETIAHRQARDD